MKIAIAIFCVMFQMWGIESKVILPPGKLHFGITLDQSGLNKHWF